MTIRKRLTRSNLVMILIPVAVTALMLASGLAAALYLLETVYLPQLGLSLTEVHNAVEQHEQTFATFEVFVWIYVAVLGLAVVLSIVLANQFLTRFVFRRIQEPLEQLVAGVDRIRSGNLEAPIAYDEPDEFRPACEAVNLMAARLRASMELSQHEQQSRKELFAGMSHDLRSPLTAVRAYTEALLEGVARTPEAQQRYLEIIHDKACEIERMVEQLFLFSKMDLEDFPVQPERLELRPEISRIVEETPLEGLAVSMDALEPGTVLADRLQLQRIVCNLMENSRKYRTAPLAHLDISARFRDGWAELRFADDGPGVPEETLPRLFDVFYRTDPARRNPNGGSGLGLAIVAKAMQRMGGTAAAENRPEGGLTVTLRLPAAEKEDPHAENSDY